MNNVDRMFAEASGAADFARRYVTYLGRLLSELDFGRIEELAHLLEDARRAGRSVYLVGNGGSAATASH